MLGGGDEDMQPQVIYQPLKWLAANSKDLSGKIKCQVVMEEVVAGERHQFTANRQLTCRRWPVEKHQTHDCHLPFELSALSRSAAYHALPPDAAHVRISVTNYKDISAVENASAR